MGNGDARRMELNGSGTDRTPGEEKGVLDEEPLVESVRKSARDLLNGARASHDWDHTQRVCGLCERIGPREGADMVALRIAALLHDIGRSSQDKANGAICHAEKGAQMARSLVNGLPLSRERRENIIHCIRSHRFRGDVGPESTEARVLFDADKLDAIGAVGVARAYLFAGEVGARLHNTDVNIEETEPYSREDTGYREYRVKLRGIRDRILTKEGRRLAEARHAFMTRFFKRFLKEYEGEE